MGSDRRAGRPKTVSRGNASSSTDDRLWAASQVGPPSTATVRELLERAGRSPHGIAVIDRDMRERRVRYEELALLASRGAHGLRRKGVCIGDRVLVISQTSTNLLITLFAVWAAGAVPVVMPLPRRRSVMADYLADVAERIAIVAPAAVLVADTLIDLGVRFTGSTVHVIGLSELEYASGGGEELRDLVGEDEVALIQFTSGTTRSSRAVTLTHKQIIENLTALGAATHIDPDKDVVVAWLPLYHDMGMIGALLMAVHFCVPLVLESPREFLAAPLSWLDALSAYGGTLTASPNFGYALAARALDARSCALDLSRVRCAYNGSEPIDIDTVNAFIAAAGPYGFRAEAITPVYGLAECTLGVTSALLDARPEGKWVSQDALETECRARPARPGERRKQVVSCGWPLPGTVVAILDEAGQRVPDEHVGEICVQSPSAMSGYWGDADATAEVLRGGWLHTGDRGFLDVGGLVICGREKDVIIVGGRNLYPEDYEWCTERIPGIRRGNVTVFALPERERMVVVAETTAAPAEAGEVAETVLVTLRERLARAPEEVVLISPGALPKTTSGKRQRSLCRSEYLAGHLPIIATAGVRA